jgi:hypothetical protein
MESKIMNRTFSIGLVLVAIGCGQQGADPEPGSTGETSSAVQITRPLGTPEQGTVQQPTGNPSRGCMNDQLTQEELTRRPPGRPVDPFYRKSAAEAEALKPAAMKAALERGEQAQELGIQHFVADPPPDSKLLERQAQYLHQLEQLRARHRYNDGAAYEKERVALKDRILQDD